MQANNPGMLRRTFHPNVRPSVMIQSGKAGEVPVFCIPGAGGNGAEFISLAAALGMQTPVYALQPRGVDGEAEPHSTIEAAAAEYVRTIDATHEAAPVHLVGHSFGGWVAFELGLRLGSSRIVSLTLIDSEPPGRVNGECARAVALERYVRTIEVSSGVSLAIDPNAFVAVDEAGGIALIHARLVDAGILPRRSRPDVLRGPIRTFHAALHTSYVPNGNTPLEIHLGLVSDPRHDAETNRANHEEALQRWRECAPNIKLWCGPGDHFSILKPPHVRALGEWWRQTVDPSAERSHFN